METETLERETRGFEEVRIQGRALVEQGRLEDAESLFASLIPACDDPVSAPAATETFEFPNLLEERYFFESRPDVTTFTRTPAPVLPAFHALCEVRVARGMLDEAMETVEQALGLNPVSAGAWLQKADILRRQRHLDEALAHVGKAHALCYAMEHFARCYRCFAQCLADAARWDVAHAAVLVSLQCEKTPVGAAVLQEILPHLDGACAVDDEGSTVLQVLEDAGLPLVPDPRWWRIAAQLAHEHLERDDPGGAIEYLKVACGLEPDADMARLVENLERSVHGGDGQGRRTAPARGFELVFEGHPPEVRGDDDLSIAHEIRTGDTVFLLRTGDRTVVLQCLRENPHPAPGTPLYTAVRTEDGGVAFRSLP